MATNNLAGRSVTLTFKEGVKKEEINAALEKIYLEAGCTGCGLAGFDLDFKVQDPVLDRIRITDLKNVAGIRILPRELNVNLLRDFAAGPR
jgi:hypothetical protein